MTCLILLFHVCVFDPSNVYLRGEMSAATSGDAANYYRPAGADHWQKVEPLVGRLELGAYVPLSKSFTLRYGVEHTSFIDQADRGGERFLVGFEWQPFR